MLMYKECTSGNQHTPSILVIAWNVYNLMSRNVFPGMMENLSKYILYCLEE